MPSHIIEWNKLDHNIRNSSSSNIFRKSILKFIRPSANSLFNCHNPKGIKFITRLRLGLSHLREHKFKHSFQDSLNSFCSCGLNIESTAHFLLHCPTYIIEKRTLLSTLVNIDSNLLDLLVLWRKWCTTKCRIRYISQGVTSFLWWIMDTYV